MLTSLLTRLQALEVRGGEAHDDSALTTEAVWAPLMKVMGYVKAQKYEGHDLFDGLNSTLLKNSALYENEFVRLAAIQFCKQSPVNFRSLLKVSRGFNPKGGALFLLSHLNLYRYTGEPFHREEAFVLFKRLQETAIQREVGLGWGYNFDWQARAFYVPVGTPNLVTSVFVGRALLDFHQTFQIPEALEMAVEIGRFILNEMVKFEDEHHLCFNYIPGKDAEVHNANLLGASYLAQISPYLNALQLEEKIWKSVSFSVSDIHLNGAWPYGTKPFHRWIDNFHTAYNIECLLTISEALQTDFYDSLTGLVTEYYLNNLFTEDGLPKYYNKKLYPIDIHVISESIIVFNRLRKSKLIVDYQRLALLEKKQLALLGEFQHPEGYFYHQKLSKKFWNKIPYIRWGQAWTFYALSTCLSNEKT